MFVISHFLCTNFGPNFHQACDYARPDELWQFQVMYLQHSEWPYPHVETVLQDADARAFASRSDLVHRIWDNYNVGHAWNSVMLYNLPISNSLAFCAQGVLDSNVHELLICIFPSGCIHFYTRFELQFDTRRVYLCTPRRVYLYTPILARCVITRVAQDSILL